jgi:spermidine/putrescine transport system ATP-binding protein
VAKKPVSTGQVEDLHLVQLVKEYGQSRAVDDLSLTIPAGSFFALLGPSGCGKTTTLRMVAGLEDPTSGRVLVGDEDVTMKRPYERPVNTVFQNYALFPHLSIEDNVAFGLKRRKEKDIGPKVADMLELVELTPMAKRKPSQLSGGQQQRVAVARALINRPDVLLLDEPLGALDLKLRRQMQIELKRIQVEVGTTFVHVTHDQEEAMTMADTVAVMNQGRIEQMGSPEEIYELPRTAFVANFLGQSNLVGGTVIDRDGDRIVVDAHGSRWAMPTARSVQTEGSVILGVRPEKLRVERAGGGTRSDGNLNAVNGIITDVSFVGVSTQYMVITEWGQELIAFEQNMASGDRLRTGNDVTLSWEVQHCFGLSGDDSVDAGVSGGILGVGVPTAPTGTTSTAGE